MQILKAQIKSLLLDLKGTHRLSSENNLAIIAGSVAFFSLFSLLPLFILTFVASHYFIGQTGAFRQSPEELGLILQKLVPSFDPSVIQGLVVVLKQNSAGDFFTFLVLIWASYELFDSLQFAFTKISTVGVDRNRFWATLMALFCFLVVIIGSTAFVIVSTTDAEVITFLFPALRQSLKPLMLNALAALTGLMSVIGSITVIYKVMPIQKVAWLNALKGSLLFVCFFILGRAGYQGYALYFKKANEGMYGPFLTFLLASVWIYYLSRIFLFAAQYAIYLEEK
ncbi:MAG: YihY/virulence factor BrkB family protein [Deltaproteobacteria bacterium]|nr:YihY/virulence factor BrkB family protein [Deltaproteobacteria bacterium]